MITTVKVLGLRARDPGTVAAAARRVVAYVQGGQPESGPAGYYAREQASGRARGRADGLVGLRGEVSGEALGRLLTGLHAVTGRRLLPASGSAGRAELGRPAVGEDPSGAGGDVLTLEQAAVLAGLSASYLRSTVSRTAREEGQAGPPPENAASSKAAGRAGRRGLRGVKDASGRWTVRREELLRWLVEREPPTVVLGYDVTCAVPKSVSLLWAFGDDELRADVAASVEAGVAAVVDYLERHAAVGTVGGVNRPGLGLAVASYLHEVSRSDEAHLHVHNVVVNAVAVPVLDESGEPVVDEATGTARVEWRALDGEVLLAHVKTAGYLGAAALRHELTRRRGLSWTAVRNGVAELDGFPADLLAAFSTRHDEVRAEYDQLVADGLTPDGVTEAAAQRGSRASKKVLADAQVQAAQHARLAEAGWTPDQVRALGARRDRRPGQPDYTDVAGLLDVLTGPGGLTARATTFTARDVLREVAGWAVDRLDADAVERLAGQVLADPRVVLVERAAARRRQRPEALFTTENLLEAEDSLLALCRQGRTDAGGPPRRLLTPDEAGRLLAQALRGETPAAGRTSAADPETVADQAPPVPVAVSAEQVEVVRRLLAGGDLVRVLVGPAGTGKTQAMRLLADVLTRAGRTVVGTAHGGRQAEHLADRLGVPARVVAGWLTLLDHTDDPTSVWPASGVLVVDEATQVSTRDAERLLRYATRTGTVVVLLGDPAQLGAVGAGGWFTHLVASSPDNVLELSVPHRQAGPGLVEVRAALAALRSQVPDDAGRALHRLAKNGKVRLFDDGTQLVEAVVDDWYAERTTALAQTTDDHADGNAAGRGARRRGGSTAGRPAALHMMAERHHDVDRLAHAARARLVADGTLTGPVLHAAGRDYQLGDEVVTLTQAGHTLVPAGRPAADYVRTGTLGRVTAVYLHPDQPERQALTVHFPGKGTVRVGWAYLTHAFPDGRDGGLGHAYALTAHKAQGSTQPVARAVAPDDTSRAGLYVMLSRASTDLTAYLVRRRDLQADLDDENWLPLLPARTGALDGLADRLAASRTERLAGEFDPLAHAAHQLRRQHSLAELHQLRRAPHTTETPPTADADGTDRREAARARLVLRRAELATETALRAAAVLDPPTALVDRIGPRPAAGPDRALWDRTTGALAVYHARYQPDAARHDPGPPPPPGDVRTAPDDWTRTRDQAEQLAHAWAARLPPAVRDRFHSHAEQVPRGRALAGLHALLDNGHTIDDLAAQLADTSDPESVRTGAAVLDHRVSTLCQQAHVDPEPYGLPPPRRRGHEWNDLVRLLDTCTNFHLARRPTPELAAEHRCLRTARPDQTGSGDSVSPGARNDRLRLLARALDSQVDHATVRLAAEPADYLTGLLGPQPADGEALARWTSRAVAVERFRHHQLGLPYGVPATDDYSPVRRALGTRPARPNLAARYDQLAGELTSLDFPAPG